MYNLPHKVGQVSWRNVTLSSAVQSLEGCVRLECLGLAEILTAKLDTLFTLTGMRKQLGKLFLGGD